ncbi:MAG: suppressor of fused domain protein [Acidobacteria bacterium]|nr:suppressor of fused domain protein [Acidobacteriota bacterium]
MSAVLFMPPVLVPELQEPLEIGSGREVQFMSPYLLRQNKLDLKLSGGLDLLFEKFAEREFSKLYDLARPSVLS